MKKFIIDCIESYRGDDLARAKRAFYGLTPKQMQHLHGQSGETRQQLLDGYKARSQMCDAAIKVVKKLL